MSADIEGHFESTRKNHFERCDDVITDLKPKTSGSAPGFVGKLLGNRLALLNLAQGTYFDVITQSESSRKPFKFYPILSPDFVST